LNNKQSRQKQVGPDDFMWGIVLILAKK